MLLNNLKTKSFFSYVLCQNVMLLGVFDYLFVGLFVYVCDYSKSNEGIFIKCFMCVGPGQRKKCLNFGKDLDHTLDTKK